MEEYYTVKEFASILKLKEMTIYKWIWKGRIKIIKIGYKVIRIPKAELQRIMED